MNKQFLQKDLESYLNKSINLRADLLRIEGIIVYLQNKIKELENSDLTNN
jgi:hypothetical protein